MWFCFRYWGAQLQIWHSYHKNQNIIQTFKQKQLLCVSLHAHLYLKMSYNSLQLPIFIKKKSKTVWSHCEKIMFALSNIIIVLFICSVRIIIIIIIITNQPLAEKPSKTLLIKHYYCPIAYFNKNEFKWSFYSLIIL